jgi:leucine-rich repeat kinase 2
LSKTNLLDYHEIEAIASDYGIFDKSELSQCIQFLHDLGSLMYFNNEFLKNKVIINPQYMVDLMACLVSINNSFIQEGRLYHSDLAKIWSKYDAKLHTWILKLTERFDLTFAVPDESMNLVPCLMADWPPANLPMDELWSHEKSLIKSNCNDLITNKETRTIYVFEYLPAGLFNRAQVRLYQLTNNKIIWRNGSLLSKNKQHIALITRNEDENKIIVRAYGMQPENLVFLIHEVIEQLIVESFNGVVYDFWFPCPDCFRNNGDETATMNDMAIESCMYSASLVRHATQKKACFLQCRHNFHCVPCVDLHAIMPPDTMDSYDMQLRHSVRELKHLKQKLTYDVCIVYAINDTMNSKIVSPQLIKQDLVKLEYSCWFSEKPQLVKLDAIALILRNASVVLFCISDNFVNDKTCVEIFHYARNVPIQISFVLIKNKFIK